jgi:hypothetical protein
VLAAPQINCFPSDDDAFVDVVRDALAHESLQAKTLDELRERVEMRIRQRFPQVRVRPRNHLADLGETAWYVYRDGQPVVAGAVAAELSPST